MTRVVAAGIALVDGPGRARDLLAATTAVTTATGKVAVVEAVGNLVVASTAAEVAASTREALVLFTTVRIVIDGRFLCNRSQPVCALRN